MFNNKTGTGTTMRNIFLAALIGIWATAAVAHSPLEGTTPSNEATLNAMPTEILMNFKGDIRLTRVTVTHSDTRSVDMDLEGQTAFQQEFSLPMNDMGAGNYIIEWRGLGTDGHVLNGSFSFTVE